MMFRVTCTHEAIGARKVARCCWLRGASSATSAFSLLCGQFGSFVFGQPLLQIRRGLEFGLLESTTSCSTCSRARATGLTIGLGLVVIGQDALVVLLYNVFGDALHTKDLDVETSSVRQSIVDGREVLFVDLTHVYAQT